MTRLTKKAVLDEVLQLRAKIKEYTELGSSDLENRHQQRFPSNTTQHPSREYMIRALLLADTYHMANVLNLE